MEEKTYTRRVLIIVAVVSFLVTGCLSAVIWTQNQKLAKLEKVAEDYENANKSAFQKSTNSWLFRVMMVFYYTPPPVQLKEGEIPQIIPIKK